MQKTVIFNVCLSCEWAQSGGAGSEAWDRVSMIALVKKFGRARLSTGFRGKETWWTSVRKVFVKICEHVAYFTFKHLK